MNAAKEPRVVAELGRPETSQESADRRAAASRKHRQNQNFFNLVIALLASLAVVAVIVLVAVRPDVSADKTRDYQSDALNSGSPVTLAAPQLPSGWWSNKTEYDPAPSDGVVNWYVGFVTPTDLFIGLKQGIDANPTWLANEVNGAKGTGSTTIDGIEWTVYDRRGAKDVGLHAYSLSTVAGQSTYVLYGTASDNEFTTLAKELATTIAADH